MGYLLVFLHPQTSTFRMLLPPLFPLALGVALLSKSKAYRGTVVLMFVLLQIVWVVWLWAWAPPLPPGGGDYPPDVDLCRARRVCTKPGQIGV